jgi:hypothetical protein
MTQLRLNLFSLSPWERVRVRGKFPLKIPPYNLQCLKHRPGGDLMILQQHNQIDGQLDLIGCIFQ